MRILPPVHSRRPFDNHAKQAPEVLAARWKTAIPPAFPTLSSSEVIHEEKTEKLIANPFLHLAFMLESENAMHSQQQVSEKNKKEEGERQHLPTGSTLLTDSGLRSDLRALGYSDKIVEKLTPYQVHWLHHYHIYNHADEILHSNHSTDAAEYIPPTQP